MFAVSASLEAGSCLLSKYSSETLGYVTPHNAIVIPVNSKNEEQSEIAEKV